MKILVIGETCKDIFYYGRVERLDPAAPAPVFNPISTTTNPGMAMNVQKNIIALGEDCGIHTNQNWSNIFKTRYIHETTNQMFIRVDTGDDKILPCAVEDIPFANYEVVVISDYNKNFLSKSDISFICENHACVFLDTKKRLGGWCVGAKYIKINSLEYDKTRHAVTPPIKNKLIITHGSNGCEFQDKIYPVKSVEIKDVSGAGDTFLSGLVVKYLQTKDITKAIIFANECATTAVQRRGVGPA